MMTLRKDDDITQDINILRTNSLFQEPMRYPCFKPEIVSQAHKDPYTGNIQIFQQIEKFKFYPKITKTGVKKMINIPLFLQTMQQLSIKTLEEVRGPLLPKKNQKHKKLQIFLKIAKIRDIKVLKTFHYISKLCSNILSNPRGSSVVLSFKNF